MKSLLVHAMAEYGTQGADYQIEVHRRRVILSSVVRHVEGDRRRKVTFAIANGGLYGNPAVFQFQFNKIRTKEVVCVDAGSFGTDVGKFASEIASIDYLYFYPRDSTEEKSIQSYLAEHGKWRLLEKFDGPTGGTVLFFSKSPDWTTISLAMTGVTGFSNPEGPYPPDKFQIRWGHGPKSVIPFTVDAAGPLEFQVEGSTNVHEQRIRILLDGTELTSKQVLAGAGFQSVNATFEGTPGEHTLEIEYAGWEKSPGHRPLAVLFRKISLIKK
jgi:hypothetical protein